MMYNVFAIWRALVLIGFVRTDWNQNRHATKRLEPVPLEPGTSCAWYPRGNHLLVVSLDRSVR